MKDEAIKRNLEFVYGRKPEEAAFDLDKRTYVRSKPKFVEVDDKETVIEKFEGEYEFLSPHFPCDVCLPNELDNPYPSYEHALQASKLSDNNIRLQIRTISNIRDVKKICVKPSQEWKDNNLKLAENLLLDKFIRNKSLKQKLIETKNKKIYFYNDYGDNYWGMTIDKKLNINTKQGLNYYGKLLEKIRHLLTKDNYFDLWLQNSFHLISFHKANIQTIVKKHNEIIADDCQEFQQRNKLLIGKSDSCDIIGNHPSLSRLQAIYIVDEIRNGLIIDLGSSNGTRVDNNIIPPFVGVPVTATNTIRFGASNRIYTFILSINSIEDKSALVFTKILNSLNSLDSKTSSDTTVFVSNIPKHVLDSQVISAFESCGEIANVSMPRDKLSGESKGFAFITFKTPSGFMQALARDGDEMFEAILHIRRHTTKEKPQRQSDGTRDPPRGSESEGNGRRNLTERGSSDHHWKRDHEKTRDFEGISTESQSLIVIN
jgi:heterogeneous nuclear ribonucleoprotein A1/A3